MTHDPLKVHLMYSHPNISQDHDASSAKTCLGRQVEPVTKRVLQCYLPRENQRLGWNLNKTDFWNGTVDGGNPANQLIGLSCYLQGFIHPRWCRISSINSISSSTLPKVHSLKLQTSGLESGHKIVVSNLPGKFPLKKQKKNYLWGVGSTSPSCSISKVPQRYPAAMEFQKLGPITESFTKSKELFFLWPFWGDPKFNTRKKNASKKTSKDS